MISALSGLVRGFSGFGSALIYIPLISAVYEPRIAAATLLLIDFISSAPFSMREFPRCSWREVAPIAIVAAPMTPIGAFALLFADPIVLRWVISALVLILLAVLASGWRYHGRPTLPLMAGVGALAGLGSGAVQIAGPPVIIFWLGGRDRRAHRAGELHGVLRADERRILRGLSGARSHHGGRPGADAMPRASLLAALWVGVRFFHSASDTTYRRIAYGIVALAALVSLPLFDGFFR